MMRQHYSGLTVGIALFGLGVLLAGGGLLGRSQSKKAARRYSSELRENQGNMQERLIREGLNRLLASIEESGPIKIVNATETPTGLRFEFQPQLDPLVNAFLDDFEKGLRTSISGIEHVVKVAIRVAGPAPDYIHTTLHSWSKGNPGLPQEVVEDPASHGVGGNYGSPDYRKSEDIWLMIPGTRELPPALGQRGPMSLPALLGMHYPDNLKANQSGDGFILDSYIQIQVYDELGGSSKFYHFLSTLFDRLSKLGFILLFIGPALGVILDARVRRLPAMLWGLFVLPTSALGALVYALVNREVGPVCPECGERVSTRFVVCPYCQTELKGTCPTCGQTVGLNWNYCPSCSTEL